MKYIQFKEGEIRVGIRFSAFFCFWSGERKIGMDMEEWNGTLGTKQREEVKRSSLFCLFIPRKLVITRHAHLTLHYISLFAKIFLRNHSSRFPKLPYVHLKILNSHQAVRVLNGFS